MNGKAEALLIALVVLSLTGALLLHSALYWPFLADDSLISLRYTARFLEGQGLTWNNGEYVEGYSNLLWVLLTTLPGLLGIDLILGARLLGVLCTSGVLIAIAGYLPGSPAHRAFALLIGGSYLVAAGPVAAWSIGGLEQPLVALLLTLAMLQVWRLWEGEPSQLRFQAQLLGVYLGLLCLTRPDAPLFVGAIALFVGMTSLPGSKVEALFWVLGVPLSALLSQTLFRALYYGELLPNTALVKLGTSSHYFSLGMRYLWRGSVPLSPLLLMVLFAGFPLLRDALLRRKYLLLVVSSLIWLGYVAAIGGDVNPPSRHFVPIVALAVLTMTMYSATVLASGNPREVRELKILYPVTLITFLFIQLIDHENRWAMNERGVWEGQAIGTLLKQGLAANNPVIAVDNAGALPFFSGLPALDMLGLNDYYLPRHPPASSRSGWIGHELGSGSYVLARRPDLVFFCTPRGGAAPCWRSGKELEREPQFYELYAPIFLAHHASPELASSEVTSQPFALRMSPKLGVRATGESIEIPAFLWANGPESRGVIVPGKGLELQLRGAGFGEYRVTIPAGRWRPTVLPPQAVRWEIDGEELKRDSGINLTSAAHRNIRFYREHLETLGEETTIEVQTVRLVRLAAPASAP